MMADGALLLVDAAEGDCPTDRFVLSKCLELGFPVIVVINRTTAPTPARRSAERGVRPVVDLEASDEGHVLVVYAVRQARPRQEDMSDEMTSLDPIFETILRRAPAQGRRKSRCRSFVQTRPTRLRRKLVVGRVCRARSA